jgi:hypothetical protein
MPRGDTARTGDTFEHGEREYFNPLGIFCERLPHMVNEAQDARLEALEQSQNAKRHKPNHRDFYVGASVLAVDVEERGEQQFTAFNTMPTKAAARVCAEKRVVDRLEKLNRSNEGQWWVVGMVIIGEPQEDRATGYSPETLWPCGESCWPGIVAPKLPSDSLLVTVRPDKRKGQVQTAEELDDFYEAVKRGDQPSEPILFHQGEEGWRSVADRFYNLSPRSHNVLQSPETYHAAVETAKVAIQGIRLIEV